MYLDGLCVFIMVFIHWYMFFTVVQRSQANTGRVESTPDEVELNGNKFNRSIIMYTDTYIYDITVTSSGDDNKTGPILAPGDIVEVCEGQLMYLQGKVINVEGDVITKT